VSGKSPELWDAETGEITQASAYVEHDGRTTVPLHLEEMGSIFVIFRRPVSPAAIVGVERNGVPSPLTALLQPDAGSYTLTTAAGQHLRGAVQGVPLSIPVAGQWTVRFPPETGANVPRPWPALASG